MNDGSKDREGAARGGPPQEHGPGPVQINVVSGNYAVPFSKGLLGQSLTATGLSPYRAHQVAISVEEELLAGASSTVNEDELDRLIEQVIERMVGEPFVERYHKWHRLALEDKPVIILIGGTTGVGKSTLATTLAHRLGIVRIIATDAIREVMRTFFSSTLMPAIHYSSFDAGGSIRIPVGRSLDRDILGFVEQVEMVNAGVTAMIARAVKEGSGIVMEGVHLVPGFTQADVSAEQALILPMVVAVTDNDLHRSHFVIRDRETDGRRPLQRYLENFDGIRKIQEYIVNRAEAEGTLVIENRNIDDSVGLVVDALYDLISAAEESTRGHREE